MRVSVERLRIWLLAGAALLVLVVAGFLGLARYRAHRFLTELPAKLGVDVRQETNGFTYSQSVGPKTMFTLHAAKAIQHKDGKYTLHDVGIAVYGHGEGQGQGDRVDRIYGKEFDLDQSTGVVRAIGEVHLDLQAPAAKDASGKMDYAAGKDLKGPGGSIAPEAMHEVGRGDARMIHVKTSGLVYLRKLGVAATDQDIEFEYNGLTGHAKGADYNADSGTLNLQSAVKVSGLQRGQPLLLTASKADLDRVNRKAVSPEGDVNGGARQTVEARHAVVTMRADSGVERLDGEGDVTVTAGDGMRMVADRGEVLMGAENRPQSAHMIGHVMYSADDATKHAKGVSSEARATFDKVGRVDRVVLSGGVHLNERAQTAGVAVPTKDVARDAAKDVWSERELNAATVDLGLATDSTGRSRPRDVKANGDARLKVVDAGKDGKGSRSSSMGAEVLTARFVPSNEGERLDEVKGDGRTTLERVSEAGAVETSSGDALEVRFRSAQTKASARKGSAAGFEGADIASALQQGHVVVTRKTPRAKSDAGASQTDRATAEKASFDGETQMLTLSGEVQLANPDGMLWADRVAVEQKTGNAAAEGSVKASYRQGSAGAGVHVLAQRAELKKASGVAVFHGSPGKLARLWEGGSQVEAPVLEFNQKQRRLVARGDGAGAPMAVHTVLVSTGPAATKPVAADTDAAKQIDPAKGSAALRRPAVVRVASREMVYSDEARTAEFTGGVRVESADGVMRGDRAAAYLQSASLEKTGDKAAAKKADSGAGFLGGNVESVTVSGGIEIDQPGRRATGDKLVYTASDGLFVLTGTQAAPPRVVDQARGAVTGVELRFRAEDESVVISNGDKGGSGLRVHTETRVKRER
jgi:lipopolysaccharide export system protein LptA